MNYDDYPELAKVIKIFLQVVSILMGAIGVSFVYSLTSSGNITFGTIGILFVFGSIWMFWLSFQIPEQVEGAVDNRFRPNWLFLGLFQETPVEQQPHALVASEQAQHLAQVFYFTVLDIGVVTDTNDERMAYADNPIPNDTATIVPYVALYAKYPQEGEICLTLYDMAEVLVTHCEELAIERQISRHIEMPPFDVLAPPYGDEVWTLEVSFENTLIASHAIHWSSE